MRALLDVNVLIALLDEGHLHHRRAAQWLVSHSSEGWASCPLTQNGCVRILSQPTYTNTQSPQLVAERLRRAAADDAHAFWPDSVSLLELQRIRWDRVLSARHITDAYLLALAVANQGRLVTFDRAIDVRAVQGAEPDQLVTLV